MDDATLNVTSFSFSRVMIDIKAEVGFPSYLEGNGEDREIFHYEVVYENPPSRYDNYICFRHVKIQYPMSKCWVLKEPIEINEEKVFPHFKDELSA